MEKLIEIEKELNKIFFEREEEIRNLIIAVLTKTNVVMLGEPGVGKSALVKDFCARIVGAKYFQRLMRRDSTTDELFGPISLKALENDEFKRNSKGKIQECHLAFIDEVMKANSTVLNGLLNIMNEKIYEDGDQVIDCPLYSLIGASNEMPMEEDLGAVWDRFLFRMVVRDISNFDNFRNFLVDKITVPTTGYGKIKKTEITLKELDQCVEDCSKVIIPDEVINSLVKLKGDLVVEKIKLTARRFGLFIQVIKAEAYLDGRSIACQDDLSILDSCIWTDPDQISKTKEILNHCLTDDYKDVSQIFDDLVVKQREAEKENSTSLRVELISSITDLAPSLKQITKRARKNSSKKVLAILKKIVAIQSNLVNQSGIQALEL